MTIARVVCVPMPVVSGVRLLSGWRCINDGPVPLRCWWSPAEVELFGTNVLRKRNVFVTPEVFGLNAWVRSVVDRFAAAGVSALAMPLFARTAPELDLSYGEIQLAEGRGHKSLPTAAGLLADDHPARGGSHLRFLWCWCSSGSPGWRCAHAGWLAPGERAVQGWRLLLEALRR